MAEIDMAVCKRKQCGAEYSIVDLTRANGRDFAEKGYCSPQCLTKDMTDADDAHNTVPKAPSPLPPPEVSTPKAPEEVEDSQCICKGCGTKYVWRETRAQEIESDWYHSPACYLKHRILAAKDPQKVEADMDKVEVALADKVHEDSKDPIAKALMSFLGKTVHITSGGQKIMGVLQSRFDGDWDIFVVVQKHTDDESGIETTRSFSFEASDVSLLNLVRENGAYIPSIECNLEVKKS